MKNNSIEVTEDFIENLEALISEEMARYKVPGSSIAIVKNDQIVYSQGFGARNLEGNLPATPETLFNIARRAVRTPPNKISLAIPSTDWNCSEIIVRPSSVIIKTA